LGTDREVSGRKINTIGEEGGKKQSKGKVQNKSKRIIWEYRIIS